MQEDSVIGAFGEEDASRLSGVSRSQRRHWHQIGLLPASFGTGEASSPYARIYSFRDLVALRVLNSLRNEHGVSLQHLREVARKLSHLGDQKWTATVLHVLEKRVVFDDPKTAERREIVSGQRVFDIPLRAAISDTRDAIKTYNQRNTSELGVVVRQRFLQASEPVFEGTRIPVSAVRHYLDRGFCTEDILAEFPELTVPDIETARIDAKPFAA